MGNCHRDAEAQRWEEDVPQLLFHFSVPLRTTSQAFSVFTVLKISYLDLVGEKNRVDYVDHAVRLRDV